MDTGRVDQQHLAFGEGGDARQPVARGLRTVGDDADLGPDQGVDQGGLADVGAADDGDVAGAVWGGIHAGIVWANGQKPLQERLPRVRRSRRGQAPSSRASTASAAACSAARSEEHTSELQSLMRISYAVFCLKKKNKKQTQ